MRPLKVLVAVTMLALWVSPVPSAHAAKSRCRELIPSHDFVKMLESVIVTRVSLNPAYAVLTPVENGTLSAPTPAPFRGMDYDELWVVSAPIATTNTLATWAIAVTEEKESPLTRRVDVNVGNVPFPVNKAAKWLTDKTMPPISHTSLKLRKADIRKSQDCVARAMAASPTSTTTPS